MLPASSPPLTLSTSVSRPLFHLYLAISLGRQADQRPKTSPSPSRRRLCATRRQLVTLKPPPTPSGPVQSNPILLLYSGRTAIHRTGSTPALLLSPTSSLRPAFLRPNEPSLSLPGRSRLLHRRRRNQVIASAIASANTRLRGPTTPFTPGIAGVAPLRLGSPHLRSASRLCVALLPHCGYGVGWTASGLRYSYS